MAAELEDLNLDVEKVWHTFRVVYQQRLTVEDSINTSVDLLCLDECLQERNQAANLEKKQKQIDKQITEWKSRYEQKEAECDQAAREARQYNTEVTTCSH